MPGILYYERYLDTLRSITDYYSTFPSNQTTYTTQVQGTSTYAITASWTTLIVDPVSWYSDDTPNFFNSQVVGYYAGGTTSQYATGVLSLPEYLYTGPILPTQERNVPVTIVQVQYTTGGETYHHRFGLIQNWEPGVTIQDPTQNQNYTPIAQETATLTLEITPSEILLGSTATFRATSSIPNIPSSRSVNYIKDAAPDTVISQATFTETTNELSVSTFIYDSLTGNLGTGTFNIYAMFSGLGSFTSATSNIETLTIYDSVPLLVSNQSLTPSQTTFQTGTTATYSLTLIQDPSYPPNAAEITNTLTISLGNLAVFTGNLSSGTANTILDFNRDLVDWDLQNPQTQSTSSYILSGGFFSATWIITNPYTITSEWQPDFATLRRGGTTSTAINVQGRRDRLIPSQSFSPLVVSASTSLVDIYESFTVTVNAPDVPFNNQLKVYATLGASQYTIGQFSWQSSSPTNVFTATASLTTAGVYTINSYYPGDILSLTTTTAVEPQNSNYVYIQVLDGNTLATTSSFQRTASNDIIRVYATTSSLLINNVEFFEGTSSLGQTTWQKPIISTTTTTTSSQLELFNFASQCPQAVPYWISNERTGNPNVYEPYYFYLTPADVWNYYSTGRWSGARIEQATGDRYPFNYWPMAKTLFRYKSSSETTSSWLANSLDSITTTSNTNIKLGTLGYNVIGIKTQSTSTPISELTATIQIGLYNYDLVEYIGYNQEPLQAGYTKSLPVFTGQTTSSGYIHYFKFTPEIPASENTWNLFRPRANFAIDDYSASIANPDAAGFGNVYAYPNINGGSLPGSELARWFSENILYDEINPQPPDINGSSPSGRTSDGRKYFLGYGTPVISNSLNRELLASNMTKGYYLDLNTYNVWRFIPYFQSGYTYYTARYWKNISALHQGFRQTSQNFGNQVWQSTNNNNPSDNEQARRANDWFQNATNPNRQSFEVSQQTTVINYDTSSNVWIATLTLPLNTVSNPANLRYVWPGTLGSPANGNFFGFDRTVTYP